MVWFGNNPASDGYLGLGLFRWWASQGNVWFGTYPASDDYLGFGLDDGLVKVIFDLVWH